MTLTPVKPPRRALWEITWKCDLRCEHCLVEGGTAVHDELSPEEALALVDQLADLGVAAVSLTGGEPFLRRDWRAIAEHVRRRGMALRFSANGHLLDDEIARTLVEMGAESFSVSIDGLPATHDRLRHGPPGDTRSSFALVIAALDRLRATPMLATVRTTITKQNLDELPALHTVLKEHGVQRWVLQLAHRTGRLAGERAAGVCDPIDPAQLIQVADFIVAHADDPLLPPRAFNNIGYLGRQEPALRQAGRSRRNPLWNGCSCGVSVVGIEPDGGIKGCANQVGEPFVVGNIRRERLADIWNDRPRWHWLHPAPEQMTGYCAGCALAKVCGAGCTTLAYRSTGELFNNPYCLRRLEREGQGVAR